MQRVFLAAFSLQNNTSNMPIFRARWLVVALKLMSNSRIKPKGVLQRPFSEPDREGDRDN